MALEDKSVIENKELRVSSLTTNRYDISFTEDARLMYGKIDKPYVEEIFASSKCCGCRRC